MPQVVGDITAAATLQGLEPESRGRVPAPRHPTRSRTAGHAPSRRGCRAACSHCRGSARAAARRLVSSWPADVPQIGLDQSVGAGGDGLRSSGLNPALSFNGAPDRCHRVSPQLRSPTVLGWRGFAFVGGRGAPDLPHGSAAFDAFGSTGPVATAGRLGCGLAVAAEWAFCR